MTTSSLRLGAIGLGLLVAGLAATGGFAKAPSETVACGLTTGSERGMLAIEGAILSPDALTGEYRFAVRSQSGGGSSNISQGGYFTTIANEETALGKVLLNAGSTYDIAFTVIANGKTLTCDQDMASLR